MHKVSMDTNKWNRDSESTGRRLQPGSMDQGSGTSRIQRGFYVTLVYGYLTRWSVASAFPRGGQQSGHGGCQLPTLPNSPQRKH